MSDQTGQGDEGRNGSEDEATQSVRDETEDHTHPLIAIVDPVSVMEAEFKASLKAAIAMATDSKRTNLLPHLADAVIKIAEAISKTAG